MAEVDLVAVTKRYGSVTALSEMDFHINDGEFVVLLGPSGCGKTTTLRMISGLETVSGGHIRLNGRDVTEEIRAPEVSEAASRVAADPGVRAALVARQRELIAGGGWVAEGRDIGTVVAPEAALKVFLTAEPHERARRRAAELGADQATVLAEQALRDQRDSTRAHSPLRPAAGAVTLDTTSLSVEEVVGQIAALARAVASA